jgi:hypothetical protein
MFERRTSDNLFVLGRLKDGVSDAQARAELETITSQLGARCGTASTQSSR